MICIVIPYFQRSQSVLQRALASIAAQRDCPLPLHVVVVDDASPVPAEGEIAAAAMPASIGLTLVRQANAGPGAARNAGLNAVPATTRYIAFLDSDDEWSADHLARAALALEAGFDFYFADHYQLEAKLSAFVRGGRIKADEHPALPLTQSGLHAYRGDMVDQIVRGNVIGTSTVVYRWPHFSALRFRVEYTSAGEDYLFWLELTRSGARFAFSTQVEATYGRGVNVYAGAQWGTSEHMLRVYNELKYRKAVLAEFSRTPEQGTFLRTAIHRLRRDFVRDLLSILRHRKAVPLRVVRQYLGEDAQTLWFAPSFLFDILKGKP